MRQHLCRGLSEPWLASGLQRPGLQHSRGSASQHCLPPRRGSSNDVVHNPSSSSRRRSAEAELQLPADADSAALKLGFGQLHLQP